MNSMNIKKGDKVKVLAGKDKGKEGTILRSLPQKHVSNVMLVCPSCKQPTRVSNKRDENGKKVRVCKKCGKDID